jgi:signal transduction histidine kinase
VRANAAPVFDKRGALIGVVTVIVDITENLRLQRQRDCLAALITHDIKSHLLAEEMLIEYLLHSVPELFNQETVNLMFDMREANAEYLGIANSLLDVLRSSFFPDRRYAQDFDVEPLVQKAVDLSAVEAELRQVRVTIAAAVRRPRARGLPSVIQQVIFNLIRDAIKASPEHGVVKVSVSSTDGQVVVRVKDSGAYRCPQSLAELFNPLRVSTSSLKIPHSSEFGLYLSAMLIEGQGGTMRCASQHGKGTTMVVTLPVAEPRPQDSDLR